MLLFDRYFSQERIKENQESETTGIKDIVRNKVVIIDTFEMNVGVIYLLYIYIFVCLSVTKICHISQKSRKCVMKIRYETFSRTEKKKF